MGHSTEMVQTAVHNQNTHLKCIYVLKSKMFTMILLLSNGTHNTI